VGGQKLLTNKEFEKIEKITLNEENKKKIITVVVCFITALLAGLTIWSVNGTITTITHWSNSYASGDDISTTTVDPVVQGTLAFLTIGFLFISIVLLNRSGWMHSK
jgi:hypothetical protein